MIVTNILELKAMNQAMDDRIQEFVNKVKLAHPKSDHDLIGWADGQERMVTTEDGHIKILPFPHPQSIIGGKHPHQLGVCEECGEAEFGILDQKTGLTGPRCRQCFNAIMRQSLQHHQYTAEICYPCEITYDSVGLIGGAIHHVRPYDDEVLKVERTEFATADQVTDYSMFVKDSAWFLARHGFTPAAVTVIGEEYTAPAVIRRGWQPLIDAGRVDITSNTLTIRPS